MNISLIAKIHDFWGGLTDISAKTAFQYPANTYSLLLQSARPAHGLTYLDRSAVCYCSLAIFGI